MAMLERCAWYSAFASRGQRAPIVFASKFQAQRRHSVAIVPLIASSPAITKPHFAALAIGHGVRCCSTSSLLKGQLIHEIDSNPVVIFGESRCLALASAQKKMRKLGIDPVVFKVDLGEPDIRADVMAILEALTQSTSLPHVFVAGTYMPGEEAVASKLKHVKALVEKRQLESSIDREINANSVVIFSKLYCPLSSKSKKAFQDIGIQPVVFEIDSDKLRGNRHAAEDLHAALVRMTNHDSLPYIFVDGSFLGGYEDVAALAASDRLSSLAKVETMGTSFATLADSVRREIESNPVVIFSGSSGRLNDDAADMLRKLHAEPVFFDMDAGDADLIEQVATVLHEMTGVSSPPYAFIDGRFIGGNMAIVDMASNRKRLDLSNADIANGMQHF